MILANSIVLMLGAALLSVPIVLHFLMQPKPKVAIFPAIRFLREQHLATRRQLKIRHWLLLALRALMILLLALALAGPSVSQADFQQWLGVVGFGVLAILAAVFFGMAKVGKRGSRLFRRLLLLICLACLATTGFLGYRALFNGSSASIGNSAEPVTALVIVDNSPRMTYVRENVSNLSRAQEMANWVLSQIPPDSQISVMDLANSAPFYSVDLAAAKKRIETLSVSYQSLTVPEAVRRGFDFIKNANFERREIYIVSDLTQPGWASSVEMAAKLSESPNTSVFVIDVGTAQPINLAISEIKLDADRLTTSSKLSLAASVVSSGQAEQRTIQLAVEKPDTRLPVIQDNKTIVPNDFWIQSESVTVPAQGAMNVTLQLGQTLPVGVHHGTLSVIGGDGLEIDNRRHFTVEVGDAWKVLVAAPARVETTFLTGILRSESLVRIGAAPFEVEETTPDKLLDFSLSQFNSVYLLDPSPISEETWQALRAFVAQGGGLGIFLGNNARRGAAIDTSFTSPAAKALLGGEITNLFERPFDIEDPKRSLWHLSPKDFSHPIFKLIRRADTSFPWHQYPVYYHWGLVLENTPEFPTQVILEYSNREPAIIERGIGSGRIITMTTPITEPRSNKAWNRLLLGPSVGYDSWAMFAILKQMTYYLATVQQDTLNIQAGQVATLKNDLRKHPDSYTLFTPNLEQAPTRIQAGNDFVRYKFTDMPGHYRMKGTKDDLPILRGFSANLSPAATDLTRIGKEQLDKFFGEDRYQLATQKIEVERQQGTSRTGQEFYPLIIAMMCVVFAMEYLMSNRFYNRSAGRTSDSDSRALSFPFMKN
ncbi:MAG: BatA domain-containing protein [Pirellulaceae bacterium]